MVNLLRYFLPLHTLLLLSLGLLMSVPLAYSASTDGAVLTNVFNPDISKKSLQGKIDALALHQELDDKQKSDILKLYQLSESNLVELESYQEHYEQYKNDSKTADEDIKKLQRDIDQAENRLFKAVEFDNIPADELEQRLALVKEQQGNLDEQAKRYEDELNLQQTRPNLIRQEIIKAQQELESLAKQLAKPSLNTEEKYQAEAQQIYLKTLNNAKQAQIKMLEMEASSNPKRIERLKAQQELVNAQKRLLIPTIEGIETAIGNLHHQQARALQNTLSQVEKNLQGKHKKILDYTKQNIEYSQELQKTNTQLHYYADEKIRIDNTTEEIKTDFKSAEKKISLAGLSPVLGKILREQRRNLDNHRQLVELLENAQNETAQASLAQFSVEDRLKHLQDIDAELQAIMQDIGPSLADNQRMQVQVELRDVLLGQKETLNKLTVAYDRYLRTLGDLDFSYQQMTIEAKRFADYLDERLLWVPSSGPINTQFFIDLLRTARWFLSPQQWLGLAAACWQYVANHPFIAFICFWSLVLLYVLRQWAKQQLLLIEEKVRRIYTDGFYHTPKALVYTVLIILPLPMCVFALGWFLQYEASNYEFHRAVGQGLQATALPLFFIQFFYMVFSPTGIAGTHFQWQPRTTILMHRQFNSLRLIVVPCVFLMHASAAAKVANYGDSLGRLALIVSMMVFIVFLSRLLHPSKGLLLRYVESNPDGWVAKSRYFCYLAAFIIPLAIIGFAVAGYYWSALELQQKLIITLRLLFSMMIFHALVIRWLGLVNRHLALQNARQKRRAALQQERSSSAVGNDDPILPIDEHQLDIPKINEQTIKIVHVLIGFGLIVGCWLIWKNILPAFSFIDQIELWQYVAKKGGQEYYQSVTLTNLLLACLYVFILAVSVWNLSGVMEILVFRRFAVEAGGRYAINQLAKYVLIALGFILVANELGGSWSQVQWLVAALSVGLGFGLQEIFANLVSGIILLFERPIRVGDTVTIGDVSGKVSRIQMRATTLVDFDQKELIVPNKTFITSQLVNWTLTDSITRVVIPVGIAYGSDVEFTYSVILKTTLSCPLVLSDPPPSVIFTGFGESALNFSIRIYVDELANRLAATHDLHIRLDKALKENNIDIPYPQRDIHIRSFVQDRVG